MVAARELQPLQNGMDVTRVIRVVNRDRYLVGKAFPQDVRCFPSPANLDQALNWEQIQQYIFTVREEKTLAAEA